MMKKHIFFSFALVGLLLFSACTDKLDSRISELREEVSQLEERVAKYNNELHSLSNLVKALEQNDHIKSITTWNQTGYRILFTSGASIFLYQGTSGLSPIVGIQYNEAQGHYYWTVQMGPNGAQTWMTNAVGVRLRASGVVPKLKIEDGVWWYTFDDINWIKCNWGNAQGQAGTSVFSDVEIDPDGYYVKFTLAGGTVFQIPTQKGFDELSSMCDNVNKQFDTYTKLVGGLDSSMFIRSVVEIQENGVAAGYRFTLGDGSVLEVRNGGNYDFKTQISARKDTDGKYYWTFRQDSTEAYQWLLYNGSKLPVSPEDASPRISIVDSLGVMYFAVSYQGGEPQLMTGSDGNPVQASGRAGISYFKSASISDTVISLVTTGGTVFNIPVTRVYYPGMSLVRNGTTVTAGTSYDNILQAKIVDTLQMTSVKPDFAAYMRDTGTRITAVAVDGGYATEPVVSSFSYKHLSQGTEYTIVMNIPFVTAPVGQWKVGRKTHIAVFLTWGSNTQMKTAAFDNI